MSRIASAFADGKAFVAFITCGDPDLETTAAVVRAAVENGADLIELGIPFSDPTAEGPVIQGANLRALRGGVTTDGIFALVRELRRDVAVPMVFMTYANVVFSYGTQRFLSACSEAGIDGLILPDLPFEEKEEFLPDCRRYGVALISLIAPTSENRIAMIAREAEGFVYLVSSLGVTGTRSEITERAVRHRLRHFHAGTGQADGGAVRRRDCRLGHCPARGNVRKGFPAACRGICKADEERDADRIKPARLPEQKGREGCGGRAAGSGRQDRRPGRAQYRSQAFRCKRGFC